MASGTRPELTDAEVWRIGGQYPNETSAQHGYDGSSAREAVWPCGLACLIDDGCTSALSADQSIIGYTIRDFAVLVEGEWATWTMPADGGEDAS